MIGEELSAFSEPVTKLVEKVASAIGVLYEPRRIRRKASADAEALLISTRANIDAKELASRAAYRLTIQEIKYQKNIETILENAINYIDHSDTYNEDVDEDFLINFFENCKSVSENELQQLWSKILATTVNGSCTTSRQTLNVLKILSPFDARIFEEYSRYIINISNVLFRPKTKYSNLKLSEEGIHIGKIGHLDDLGLIRMDSVFYLNEDVKMKASYCGDELYFIPKSKSHLRGERLTYAGEQIYNAIGLAYDEKYLQEVKIYLSNFCKVL
ncbi:DUF2806 domain-containing protein [Vallitalea okinawensis]|uniref:DUF2806 domain-containing protein n=1 Tax=Vallitalea okinawensis TaxID=2078660 RepID=UPI000CFB6C1D|nr:DUF2806 domain-containing protein [Vallitalea okinawensis]